MQYIYPGYCLYYTGHTSLKRYEEMKKKEKALTEKISLAKANFWLKNAYASASTRRRSERPTTPIKRLA